MHTAFWRRPRESPPRHPPAAPPERPTARRCAARADMSCPSRSGWPWSSFLRWRRVDRERVNEGQKQALRRPGNGACLCLARARGWRVVCTVGRSLRSIHQAPSGSGAQGGKRRAALSSVAISPRGVSRCGASSARPTPVNAAVRGPVNAAREHPRPRAALPPRPAGLPGIAAEQGVYPLHPRARASLTSRTTREKR